MRLRTATILATAALGLAIPAAGLASQSTTIGPGKKSCVPGPVQTAAESSNAVQSSTTAT